jgi:hypothetical protein
MILLDANVLLYAYDKSSPFHDRAQKWLEEKFSGQAPVALTWITILAFLRISTNSRAVMNPLSIETAIQIVSSWLKQPCTILLNSGDRCWQILDSLLTRSQAKGPLVMDAYLAALALEHGFTLITCDRDFSRFDGLRTSDPLQEAKNN